MQAQDFDVVELTETEAARTLGYDDNYRGLVVQYQGEWLADATDLTDAAGQIAQQVGHEIDLKPAPDGSYTGERRWTVDG